ncbi:hypothetical protein GQ607_015766 [Colletotrichum asianum]|uniref:Uncharacterized protein n=1 Tax=Colletotrichum asianum TaxID=702518 RepID=A0A8H3VXW5_9PEZI|nr:hypothetical protein GQ607_015766 [Colletotrichum asianum]
MSTMPSIRTAINFLLALGIGINPTSAAHAGFHVQFPWLSRGQNPWTRPEIDQYNPFCRMTKVGEMGVMYFEARDPQTGNVEYHCSNIKMADMEALPEEHPAMCAAGNQTLIPMPDGLL